MARWLIGFELPDADPERLEELTLALLDELRQLGEARIDRVDEPAPEGAKSGVALQIGSLVVSGAFSAATAAAFAKVMVARFDRAKARKVTIKKDNGQSLEFDALSKEDQHVLVEKFAAQLVDSGAEDGAVERA